MANPIAVIEVNEDPNYTWRKDAVYGGASLTEFYCPLPVFFEGWKSTPRADIKEWRWNFGDGSPEASGFNASHIYETPGEYTVTLTVRTFDGLEASDTLTITAWDRATSPARHGGGRTVYVDAIDGNDDNDGLSPATAKKTAQRVFNGLMGGWWKPGDRILFKRGQTFPIGSGLIVVKHGQAKYGYTFGAYGDPELPRPVIQHTGPESGAIIYFEGVDWGWIGFEDLVFDGTATTSRPATLFRVNGRGSQLHFNRCRFQNGYQHVGVLGNFADGRISNITLKNCESYNAANVHFFCEASAWAMTGGDYDLSENHILYGGHVNRAIIARNRFSRPPFGRHSVRISAEACTVDGAGVIQNPANNVHILENTFEGWVDPKNEPGTVHSGGGVRWNICHIEIKPNTSKVQEIRDVLVERNTITGFEAAIIVADAEDCTIRQNVLATDSDYNGADRIQIGHPFERRPSKNIAVEDNIIDSYENRAGDAGIVGVNPYTQASYQGLTRHTGITIRGNRVRMRDGNGRFLRVAGGGLGEITGAANSIYTDDDTYHFYQHGGSWNNPGDLYTLSEWKVATGQDADSALLPLALWDADLQPIEPDLTAPATADTAPIEVSYSGAAAVAPATLTAVQLYVKPPGASGFSDSGLSSTGESGTFQYVPTSGNGVYGFAAVAVDSEGRTSGMPTMADVSTVYEAAVPDPPPVTEPVTPLPEPVPANELEAVIAALLRPGTALNLLVENRIFPEALPQGTFANKAPALVVQVRGGSADEDTPNSVLSVQIRCFGGTTKAIDAYRVYYALRQRLRWLKNEKTAEAVLLSALEEMSGRGFINPQTLWWEVLCAWRFNVKPL